MLIHVPIAQLLKVDFISRLAKEETITFSEVMEEYVLKATLVKFKRTESLSFKNKDT